MLCTFVTAAVDVNADDSVYRGIHGYKSFGVEKEKPSRGAGGGGPARGPQYYRASSVIDYQVCSGTVMLVSNSLPFVRITTRLDSVVMVIIVSSCTQEKTTKWVGN